MVRVSRIWLRSDRGSSVLEHDCDELMALGFHGTSVFSSANSEMPISFVSLCEGRRHIGCGHSTWTGMLLWTGKHKHAPGFWCHGPWLECSCPSSFLALGSTWCLPTASQINIPWYHSHNRNRPRPFLTHLPQRYACVFVYLPASERRMHLFHAPCPFNKHLVRNSERLKN